jgi:hypothetical protein
LNYSRVLWFVGLVTPAAWAFACSSESRPPVSAGGDLPVGIGGGNHDAGPIEAAPLPAPSQCTTLIPADTVTQTGAPADNPVGAGGTLENGVYHITQLIEHGGKTTTDVVDNERWLFDAGHWEQTTRENDASVGKAGTYIVREDASPPALELTTTCPSSSHGTATYTATPTSFTLFTPVSSTVTDEFVFVRE